MRPLWNRKRACITYQDRNEKKFKRKSFFQVFERLVLAHYINEKILMAMQIAVNLITAFSVNPVLGILINVI